MGARLSRQTEAPTASDAVGLWQVDASTNFASLDAQAAAMLKVEGYSPGQPVHLEEVMSRLQEEDRDLMREIHLDVTRNGGPFLSEFRVIDAAGDIRWIQCRGQYALGEGGVMTGRGVLVDVTDLHAWSGPIPSQSAVLTVRQPPTAAPTARPIPWRRRPTWPCSFARPWAGRATAPCGSPPTFSCGRSTPPSPSGT